MIELFLIFIFYHYSKIEEEHFSEALFLEMKNYSFNFDDTRFDMDIVSNADEKVYELLFDTKNVFIYTPLLDSITDKLKVYYPLVSYQNKLNDMRQHLYWQFTGLTIIALLMALLFSYYTLRPLRNSLRLLEEFIKDIIHDLNTPISSILINLKMMEKNDEVESIEHSAKGIAMLHKNLDSYLRELPLVKETLDLKTSIEEQIAFFKPLYDYLDWKIDVESHFVQSDKNALGRILYNLIGNACKYNTTNGSIHITVRENYISISNTSYGIKEPSKVFNRFYKESERGLGIGLHIVAKLSEQLEIKKSLVVQDTNVVVTLTF